MYNLTEKGLEELRTYSDSTEEDLRLNRRSLIVPLLESIYTSDKPTMDSLMSDTGLTAPGVRALLGVLSRQGLVTRVPPSEFATEEEKRSWSQYRADQKRKGQHPSSRECRLRASKLADEAFKERYPELYYSKALDHSEFKNRSARKRWYETKGGEKAYNDERFAKYGGQYSYKKKLKEGN